MMRLRATSSSRLQTRLRRASGGFTLVELLVSMTGALFISMSVFMLAKHTTEFYQREAHVANASLASVVGFERLRSDIARAGFMASPNVQRDPLVCGTPIADAAWPALLKTLASIRIEPIPSQDLPTPITDNGIAPQRITLAGNYSSSEAFPVRSIVETNNEYHVYLQVYTGAMARLGYGVSGMVLDEEPTEEQTAAQATESAAQAALLGSVFPAGRAVRIVDRSGRHHYGIITGVTGGEQPTVRLTNAPALQFRETSTLGCGLQGEETGAMINTVNFVRYTLRSLANEGDPEVGNPYAPLYDTSVGPAEDAQRVELVREELDPAGAPISGTAELVAEYAVDLRFQLTVAPSTLVSVLYVPEAEVANWAGPVETLSAGRGPQLARAVHAWLSVRSRSADRKANIDSPAGPLFRIGLGADGEAPFARVRTVQARVALHNQTGVTWQ